MDDERFLGKPHLYGFDLAADKGAVDGISYAYKLKKEKKPDDSTASEQLDEILANVPNTGGGE